ncbi:MAG: hypothetical protein AAFO73_04860 [Pseudomonadota bacterium]
MVQVPQSDGQDVEAQREAGGLPRRAGVDPLRVVAVLCGGLFLAMGLLRCVELLLRASGFGSDFARLFDLAPYGHAAALLILFGVTLALGRHVSLNGFSTGNGGGMSAETAEASVSRPSLRDNLALMLSLTLAVLFGLTLLIVSLPYVSSSFAVGERFGDIGGLPGLYAIKALLLVMAAGITAGAVAYIFRQRRHVAKAHISKAHVSKAQGR